MKIRFVSLVCSVALCTLSACDDGRNDALNRELGYMKAGKGDDKVEIPDVPAHPVREDLRPLLEALFEGERLPDVLESPEVTEGDFVSTPGVLAEVRLKPGLSGPAVVKAIVLGTAEADAWIPRDGARRSYAEQINKVATSFKEEKTKVLSAYGDLRLLAFFNDPATAPLIAALPASVQGAVSAMSADYTGKKDEIWGRWMGVKMYARRAVAGDEPFKSMLRDIRRSIGVAEPKPLSWEESHGPRFTAWAKEVNSDDAFFAAMTNLRELKDQELFRGDTHAMWLEEGSDKIPAKAKDAKMDKELGFAVHREDLGGGFQEMIFIFKKGGSEAQLKYAYLRSQIYRHLFSDFRLLSTAGGDFKEGIVPDKYDEVYAFCGSQAALDSFLIGFKGKYPIIAGVKPSQENEDKILKKAHDCVLERAAPDIKTADPDDEMDVEGSAPGSRLGLYQMLARFENAEVNLEDMKKDPPKSQDVMDAEAFLKANKNKQN